MRLESGQVHMNFIICNLVALLYVGRRLKLESNGQTNPIPDQLVNCTVHLPKRSGLAVVGGHGEQRQESIANSARASRRVSFFRAAARASPPCPAPILAL